MKFLDTKQESQIDLLLLSQGSKMVVPSIYLSIVYLSIYDTFYLSTSMYSQSPKFEGIALKTSAPPVRTVLGKNRCLSLGWKFRRGHDITLIHARGPPTCGELQPGLDFWAPGAGTRKVNDAQKHHYYLYRALYAHKGM